MSWPDLAATLTALVASVEPPVGYGLALDAVELDVPLEVRTVGHADGIAVLARPPHSRWQAGVLPEVQMARLVIGPVGDGAVAEVNRRAG